MGEQIKDYFGDGSNFGLKISYHHGEDDWDTARRVYRAKELLKETFFLLYGDNFIPYSLKEMFSFFQGSGSNLSLGLTEKANGNMRISNEGKIEVYDSTRSAKNLSFVELGYMIVNRDPICELIDDSENRSFSEVIKSLVDKNDISGYHMRDVYYSISDPERLKLMKKYLEPKKILLLDRDGTVCVKAPRGKYNTKVEDFVFLDGAIEGLKKLSDAGYRLALITNQAGVSTGDLSEEALNAIHDYMNSELSKHGVSFEQIYCCFAHWQDSENWWRKPNPGMLMDASKDMIFRLDETFYVGDDIRDMIAAYRANCRGIFIGNESGLGELENKYFPAFCASNLIEVADYVMEQA